MHCAIAKSVAAGLLCCATAIATADDKPNLSPDLVGWKKDGTVARLARLDSAGNVLRIHGRIYEVKEQQFPYAYNDIYLLNSLFHAGNPWYEYRSGMLVLVALDRKANAQGSHSYTPFLSSTVIRLEDYYATDGIRFVYNHRESWKHYHQFWNRVQDQKAKNPLPDIVKEDAVVSLEDLPMFWVLERFSDPKAFLRPKFARVLGDRLEFGTLTDTGDFDPDDGLPPQSASLKLADPFTYFAPASLAADKPEKLPLVYNLPRNGKPAEDVFEYRSGRLIEGELRADGNFVPKLGSKVTAFKDYAPGTTARRVYNLPGILRPAVGK